MPKLDELERFSPTDGTRKYFESGWVFAVASGEAVTIPHDLGEIPVVADVIQSSTSDGRDPITATATITKTVAAVTVANTDSVDAYFKVRAL